MTNTKRTEPTRPTIVLDTPLLAARPYAGLIIKNIRERLNNKADFTLSSSAKSQFGTRPTIWITSVRNIYPYHPNANILIAAVDYNIGTLPPTLVTAINRYVNEIWVWDSKTAELCKISGIAPYKIHLMSTHIQSEKTAQEIAERIETIIENIHASLNKAAIESEERRWLAIQSFKPAPTYIAERLKKAA